MVVPESQHEHLNQIDSVGRDTSQQCRPNLSASQHFGGPLHLSTNGSVSPDNTMIDNDPHEYTESDFLLPTKLYGASGFSRSTRARDPGGAGVPAEKPCSMVLQIVIPFMLAGFGTVSAGILLDVVQSWGVFQEITEIFILIPAVLGMKRNLEMTLASRLSTTVNAGKTESAREMWMLIIGNLALKQLQATVLGLLASLMAAVFGWMAEGKMPFNHVVLLCSTSVSTAFMASLLQGIIMVGVITGTRRLGMNPDNVATPLASGFGDLITLAFLAGFSQWFYALLDFYPHVLYLVDLSFLSLIPLWIILTSKHPATVILLRTGWEPIITAMLVSSIGGVILDKTVSDPNLAGIIVYAPVINGIGGNLVSIQSSRLSTNLHLNYSSREIPADRGGCYSPCTVFFGSGTNHQSARVLLLLAIPGQFIFLYTIHLMTGGSTLPSLLLIITFLSASLIQVVALLCLADCLAHCLWRRGKDPDSYAIPYLTTFGDLLGTALLALNVFILWCLGDAGSGYEGLRFHSEGLRFHSEGLRFHSEGLRYHSEGLRFHSEGLRFHSEGLHYHSEGLRFHSEGLRFHSEGLHFHSEGLHFHRRGYASTARGYASTARGYASTARGYASTARGYATTARGYASTARGYASTARGYATTARGYASTARGYTSTGRGYASTGRGYASTARGYASTGRG
ncbi:solute carrier family 41 member 2-like [Brachionichthys hirsutus]|uniref:solute carrier family 41 member 2-like n=1 Tax=Brachionichthys hirsutus TaxID=412623 RepID=UPI00360453CF